VNPPTIRVVHNNNVFLASDGCEKSGFSMFTGSPDGKGRQAVINYMYTGKWNLRFGIILNGIK
jgi:hypothetical protein